ncbi:MAG: hypothetical protein QM212_01905 [Bacteroidota bacterium]|nr:hypothetical protein [Bacteroidota bacterium]
MLLICLPYIVSAQWQIGGNSGLSENRNALGTTDNVSVKFITNDIVRMRLMPNGNFGIGTDEPQRLLHVNGAIRFQNLNIGTQTTALMIDANGDLSLRALNNVAFSGSYNDLINKPTLFDGNWSSLQGTAPAISSFTNDVGYITNADDADADPTNELQDLSLNEDFLSISGGNGVSLKGINYWSKLGDNLYYNSGKVGIGTDEPNKLLHLHSEEVFGIEKPVVAHSNFELQPKSLSIPISLLSSESALLLTNKNSGRTSADGLLIRSTNNNATISLQEDGELSITTKKSLRFKMQQNGNVSIGTPMTNFFTVKENGNVGIGTSDPVAKLHIKDDKIIVERNQKYIHINASNTDAEIGSSTGQIKFWYTNGVGYNDLYCKNLYCKDLYSNGNVGIGTDEPMFKLDVRGTGHFCKIKVKTQGFCDYVFNDDYKLMPLDELSEFIKINKHLPNIPSEKEVMEEGSFDLGEINKVLLEKIEELTLYILQQEERIKALEAEVKK